MNHLTIWQLDHSVYYSIVKWTRDYHPKGASPLGNRWELNGLFPNRPCLFYYKTSWRSPRRHCLAEPPYSSQHWTQIRTNEIPDPSWLISLWTRPECPIVAMDWFFWISLFFYWFFNFLVFVVLRFNTQLFLLVFMRLVSRVAFAAKNWGSKEMETNFDLDFDF